jgi:hypothetical protein
MSVQIADYLFSRKITMVVSDVYTAVWKKLIYEIYHVYGSGKRSVLRILGVTAFSGNAFSYSFWQNVTFDTG